DVYENGSGKLITVSGGIMPDIYVPLDTTGLTPFYHAIQDRDLVRNFIYHRLIDTPPSFAIENFIEDYEISNSIYRELIQFAREGDISFSIAESNLSRNLIESEMKATRGRYLFGDEAWLRVRKRQAPAIARSLQVLNNYATSV